LAKQNEKRTTDKKRWAKFTYIGKEIRQVTKRSKNTNVTVAYMTKNNLEKILKSQNTPQPNKYKKKEFTNLSVSHATKYTQVRPTVLSI